MSGGFFVIDRGVWEHPSFAKEPFTERLAWIWLLSEASWKPKRVRTPHGMIDLGRGQMAHSQRFLAEKWRWDRSRVRRFMDLLEAEKMVKIERPSFDPAKGPVLTQQKAQPTTVLTICNYDKYQFGQQENDPASEVKSTQRTDEKRPKEEEVITKKEKKEVGGANASPDKVVPMRRYAFEGRVIRLEQADLNRWRQTYQAIPDIMAVLQTADDYYTQTPPKDGKWFFPVSNWLKKENDAWGEKIRTANARPDRSF